MEQNVEQNPEQAIEPKPNKKRGLLIAGGIAGVILIAAAAFIGGRLFNQQASLGGLLPGGEGEIISMSVEMVPAPELPTTPPEVSGQFAERQDNTIYIQTFSMDTGGGGVVVFSSVSGEDGAVSSSPGDANNGPKVEVVVTNDTLIYRDATEMPAPSSSDEAVTIQQKVEVGSLDDLTSQTMVTVWGRKVGDRVIADVIVYSNPIMFTAP